MSSSSKRKSETPKRSREGGSRSSGAAKKVTLQIRDSLDDPSFRVDKKLRKDVVRIHRECHAVDNPEDSWMRFQKKYAPVALYDETNRAMRVTNKDLELQMEVTCELPSGEMLSKVVSTGTLGTTFWFKSVEFSAPGSYSVTYSLPKIHADAGGYHVEPVSIPIHVLPALETESSAVATPSKRDHKKKKATPAPPTPSSATNTRRASASAKALSSSTTSTSSTRRSSIDSSSSSAIDTSTGSTRHRTSARLSDAKLDTMLDTKLDTTAAPTGSPRASRRLSSSSSASSSLNPEETMKNAALTIPPSSTKRKRSRSLAASVEESDESAAAAVTKVEAKTSKVDEIVPNTSRKRRNSSTGTMDTDAEAVSKDLSLVTANVAKAADKSATSHAEEEEMVEEERAHLERNRILQALSLSAKENAEAKPTEQHEQEQERQESGPVAGLAALLPPTLITALLDDAHDMHVRVARRDQYQKQFRSKRFKKNIPKDDKGETPELPAEVFLSASPSLTTMTAPSWSVHKILHDPLFSEFMLKKTPSNNKKKYVAQLSYNVNTFLVAFESLCHCSPDSTSGDSSSSPLCGPILYLEERRSLESSGLLDRIISSDTDFLYHHCNARHLLRALVLILLTSPKYAAKGVEIESSETKVDNAFFAFTEKVLEYLNEHAFPILYQH